MRSVSLLGVPSTAGAFAPGQELAPAALRAAGLAAAIGRDGRPVDDRGDVVEPFRWHPDRAAPRAQHAARITATVAAVRDAVAAELAAGALPVVLGGDCTTGVGTALAGADALLYLDLHADLNTPASVPDGALDWTGLAHLLGEADVVPGLTGGATPLRPEQVVLLGLDRERSTPHERARLDALGLAEVPVGRLRDDPAAAAAEALGHLPAGCERVAVHFDVDVVEFTDAPLSENVGRGTGVPLNAALAALAVVMADPRVAALTLTELNPLHGEEDGASLRAYVNGVAAAVRAAA
jgi:arginase